MDYKSCLSLIILLCSPRNILPDWIQQGRVIEVLSGDTIKYFDNSKKKIFKYQLPCVKANSVKSKLGKFQKKSLEKLISGKEISGIIRSHLNEKTGITLADIFIVEKKDSKEYYKSISVLLVKNNVLKKTYTYQGCWREDEK